MERGQGDDCDVGIASKLACDHATCNHLEEFAEILGELWWAKYVCATSPRIEHKNKGCVTLAYDTLDALCNSQQ